MSAPDGNSIELLDRDAWRAIAERPFYGPPVYSSAFSRPTLQTTAAV